MKWLLIFTLREDIRREIKKYILAIEYLEMQLEQTSTIQLS